MEELGQMEMLSEKAQWDYWQRSLPAVETKKCILAENQKSHCRLQEISKLLHHQIREGLYCLLSIVTKHADMLHAFIWNLGQYCCCNYYFIYYWLDVPTKCEAPLCQALYKHSQRHSLLGRS